MPSDCGFSVLRVFTAPDDETLRRLYIDEKQTLAEIAGPYGCSPALVRKWLLRAGIPTRGRAEARAMAKPYKPTPEHREKLRENAALARARITKESRKKQSETRKRLGLGGHNKGVPMSAEQRAKLEKVWSDPEYRRRQSERQRGEKGYHWKGGVKSELDRRLDSWEWRQTRRAVYERDNWTCQECGCKCLNAADSKAHPKRKIQCHHIVSRRNGGSDEMSNLITLCMSCHHRQERLAAQNVTG